MALKSKTLQKSALLWKSTVNSMQIVESFGKNVFVGERMVGYIDREGIFINRQKFADITPEGEISFGAKRDLTFWGDIRELLTVNENTFTVDISDHFFTYKNILTKTLYNLHTIYRVFPQKDRLLQSFQP